MKEYHDEASKTGLTHGECTNWHEYAELWVEWWKEVKTFHAKWPEALLKMQRNMFIDDMRRLVEHLSSYGYNLNGKKGCNMESVFTDAGLPTTTTVRKWEILLKSSL